MKHFLSFLLPLFVGINAYSQIDFNNYQTLQSKGDVPADFSDLTSKKIEEGMTERRTEIGSAMEQREFLEQTGYAIDELLHSGLVVYGDDLSNYVSSIGDKLLKGNPDLRSKLRFYTLKLNATNAFSTDQGIIFVTTGLISQLSSEAQLAYILAHEISHYTEKHVVETFTWKKNNRYGRDWVDRMSVYSKDKEFSADELAVDMYRKAGYAKEEILTTFDVLLYSYLPFDEVPIDLDYFATDQLFLPEFLFPTKEYEITADPDEDDSNSSHPNVSKRKEAVQKEIDGVKKSWGTTVNSEGDARFYELRNIARFESVRTDVAQAAFGNALYSIYLLEREFPESIFLQRMKMHSWLGLYQYESLSRVNKTILSNRDLEGQSAPVHYFIRKLNRKSLTTVALRHIYDIHEQYPEDLEIGAMYTYSLKLLAKDEKFDIDEYSVMTFAEYADSVELKRIQAENDTLSVKPVEEPKKKSKYDRIKSNESPDVIDESIDSLKYYYYGLADLVRDSSFLQELESYTPVESNLPPEEDYNGRRGRKYYQNKAYEELKIGSDDVIVVEPRAIDYSRKGVDLVKSEKLEGMFADAIVEAADQAGTMTHSIDKRNLTTESYNARSTLIGFLNQLVEEDDVTPFPVDYLELKKIADYNGTSNVMFTVVDHTFEPDINIYGVLLSALIYPTLPFTLTLYIPIKLMSGNQTRLTVLLMDLDSGEFKAGNVFRFNERLTKHNIGNRMYSLFKHLSSTH